MPTGGCMREEVAAQLSQHRDVVEIIERTLSDKIAAAAQTLINAFGRGNKVLVMGNGGSAADSQHFVAELVSRFKMERRGLPAIALSTDTSILTAIGNDYGFDAVFRRQVEALALPGDVVVGISTSGSSRNVHLAMGLAKEMGCHTMALLGKDGGTIKDLADTDLTVACDDTPRVQEGHITIIHIICDLVEKGMFA